MLAERLRDDVEVVADHAEVDIDPRREGDVGVRAVDAYVTRLRKKLGEARDYVETVSSVGYRLRRPVE